MLLSLNCLNYQIIHSQNRKSSSNRHLLFLIPSKPYRKFSLPLTSYSPSSSVSTNVLANGSEEAKEKYDFLSSIEKESFKFGGSIELADLKRFDSPAIEVKELDELPDQWRRSKLAWLCKELPAHKLGTFTRVLNAQRKWIRQDDCTFVAVHCMRIRENEAAFRVYKWMMQQHWFRLDFALATKLADYMGKERKYLKCREIFDDIVNQGIIPNESTFHILIVAYLSSSASSCLEEGCSIYNRMIHLGNYRPRLSLHNSLFRALVSKSGGASKHHLKQAEFIFHNLTTSRLKIHNDIYGGLIWLHSYQDVIDKERIASIRAEMRSLGIEESVEVLVSVLRACSKEGNVEEAEQTWKKMISLNTKPPSQAFVYMMEVYSKVEKPLKSLDIFRGMQEGKSSSVVAYYKIIEVLCKANEIEQAEPLMIEFINSGMKPLMKSFIDLLDMYARLNLHSKLEFTFLRCLEVCRPNRTVYNIYLNSLVQIGNLDRAEEIFNQMLCDEAIGVNTISCNTILRGYLTYGHYTKAEKIYDLMCQKKYSIESPLLEKLEYGMSLSQEEVKKPSRLELSKEQREILIALLLSGLRVKLDEETNNYAIHFVFSENLRTHSFLKRHIYNHFREWMASDLLVGEDSEIPFQFNTISHSYFKLFADQFWPQGQSIIPKLIHRWLTPRVLAYWYMYAGYRTSSGDILLKLRFHKEDVMRIVKTFKARSLECRVKRKGNVFWIGFLGNNAAEIWKLIVPFVLVDLKEFLEVGTDSVENASDYIDDDKIHL